MRLCSLFVALSLPINGERLVWVVENIDKARVALTDQHEFPNIRLKGRFREKPITIVAWQVTGRAGDHAIDMIQPGEGQSNAYTNFLAGHGDGVLAVVHETPDIDAQVTKMRAKGVAVLQQVTVSLSGKQVTYVFFDTEAKGKFVMGYVTNLPKANSVHVTVSARDPAAVLAYWKSVGFDVSTMPARDREGITFPSLPISH